MTQPEWPVHDSGSSEASFSGRYGSPPLPKMLSTKSRLDTSDPGAKKRISIRFSAVNPGTAGTTSGRSSSETKQPAGCADPAVYGSSSDSSGGVSANASSRAKVALGTAFLSSGIGSPPSAMWNTPAVVRRSLAGLCRMPLRSR